MNLISFSKPIHSLSFLEPLNKLSDSILRQFEDDNYPSLQIMNNISKLLKKFGNTGVIAFINAILLDHKYLSAIAQSSYIHQNGFFKIPLVQEEKFVIRLHIWIPSVPAKETLHNHRWYLASTVLKGNLRSEVWESSVCERDSWYDEYLYTNKNTEPHFLGKVRVALASADTKQTGSTYVLAPDILHRITVSPEDGMVATLVCRSFCVQNWSRNVIVNELVPDVTPQYMSSEALKTVLLYYLNEAS